MKRQHPKVTGHNGIHGTQNRSADRVLCHGPGLTALILGVLSLVIISQSSWAEGLGDIVASSEAVKVAGGFQFTEGPVSDAEGNLIFSDIPADKAWKWDTRTGKLSLFRENTGGGNGLRIGSDGVLYTCEGGTRRVSATFPDGRTVTVVDSFMGKPLNSPNDLWIDPAGGFYFTDPRYGNMNDLQQGGFHVYYKFPSSSRVIRVCGDLVKPNGLIGTPDGSTLYVADLGDNKTYRYDINADGTLGNRTLFARRGSDGMTMDSLGNVYLTSGAVHVYSPDGTYIGAITSEEPPANVTFGGRDGKTLFLTARTSVYAIRMKVSGQ
jgi:gluconolactonase